MALRISFCDDATIYGIFFDITVTMPVDHFFKGSQASRTDFITSDRTTDANAW
jgi:hypothetical protein